MKKIFRNIGILLGIVALFAINACEDDITPLVEELEFDRVFTPLELEAKISNQTIVTLTWGSNKNVQAYELEISDDSLDFASIIHTATVLPDEVPYVYELPAGNSQYSARVKGTNDSIADSKWVVRAFKSLPENIFANYEIAMTGLNSADVSWTPGKAVTSLSFVSTEGEVSYDISADEQAAGMKSVTDLPNGDYEVNILNGNKSRGTQTYTMEGDVFVAAGEDLATAISAAESGDVLILAAGAEFGFVGDMMLEKAIKIKGLDGDIPVIYATEGDRMFYIGANILPTEEIVFENLFMNGFTNMDASQGQIRGVFDMESEACNIGAVKFIGCKMYYMGRQIMRLRGGSDQTIGEFLVDDCIIHNLGKSSGSYGVFCATETNTNATVVKITNSTIDSLKCHFIRYDDPVACESIIVENCTFNKTPFSSGRYLMDIRNAVITSGVEVTNCIFGNTSYGDEPSITGIRAPEDVLITITNSYATTDFVNSSYSIVDLLIPLGVSSDALWKDTENGDFSFAYDAVDAGDPRWK
ncbi:DUF5123 domain-containing protein [Draconibacterium sp. IB214405]|uniref:DUF5123 domain-containing protein n=1 Tax=Draconibacterium sp. IB214405 TaxID=3097352 RepID=UPI002A1348A1|nr:DUF5123 domain-containing protein [Draconibacterium sp. IB214405]MDX8338929.1 DUF5123 domain-containing protein [Draconibacterium sp. IB214405]